MKIITFKCDICEVEIPTSEKNSYGEPKLERKSIGVIFTTEQNEGRSSEPYLETKDLHLCSNCMNEVLKGKAIYGTGAMGFNKYQFSKTL